jgi:phage terminase small subunit
VHSRSNHTMSGFTIACILGTNPSSNSNNFKRKMTNDDDDDDNEHQLHKRKTIEGNEFF